MNMSANVSKRSLLLTFMVSSVLMVVHRGRVVEVVELFRFLLSVRRCSRVVLRFGLSSLLCCWNRLQ